MAILQVFLHHFDQKFVPDCGNLAPEPWQLLCLTMGKNLCMISQKIWMQLLETFALNDRKFAHDLCISSLIIHLFFGLLCAIVLTSCLQKFAPSHLQICPWLHCIFSILCGSLAWSWSLFLCNPKKLLPLMRHMHLSLISFMFAPDYSNFCS